MKIFVQLWTIMLIHLLHLERVASKGCDVIGANPKECHIYKKDPFPCGGRSRKTIPSKFINDNYCDCPETGADEPGTSACNNGKFYCRNKKYKSRVVFSSFINDGLCDCCDGSDEWDNKETKCPNTCQRRAEIELKTMRERLNKYEQGLAQQREMVQDAQTTIQGMNVKKKNIEKEIQEKAIHVTRLEERKEELEGQEKEYRAKLKKERQEEEDKKRREAGDGEGEGEGEGGETQENADNSQESEGETVQSSDTSSEAETKEEEGSKEEENEEKEEFPYPDEYRPPDDSKDDKEEKEEEGEEDFPYPEEYRVNKETSGNDEDEGEDEGFDWGEFEDEDEDDFVDPEFEMDDDDDEIEYDEDVEEQRSKRKERRDKRRHKKRKPEVTDDHLDGLKEEAKTARDEWKIADRELKDLRSDRKEIDEFLENDFGPNNIFASIYNECFDSKIKKYTYEFCPFKNAHQKEKSSSVKLGKFESFDYSGRPMIMKFTKGQTCWKGPARSLTVLFECNNEHKVISVSEPSTCTYEMRFETPVACTHREYSRISVDINNHFKEEL